MRLRAERDRHKEDNALLREELRIKDARMANIPAHHRPFYRPTERLAGSAGSRQNPRSEQPSAGTGGVPGRPAAGAGVLLTFILNLPDLQEKEKEARVFLRKHPDGKFSIRHNQSADQSQIMYERFKRIDTVVEFVWSCNGETVVSGVDPLKRWKLAWVPAYESGGYWHPNGRDVNFSRKKVYELKLKVTSVDVHAPPLLVVPTLKGGGNELP